MYHSDFTVAVRSLNVADLATFQRDLFMLVERVH